jgi:hypothetical protein
MYLYFPDTPRINMLERVTLKILIANRPLSTKQTSFADNGRYRK